MCESEGRPNRDLQVLVACIDGTLGEAGTAWISRMSDADWQGVVSLAQAHNLAPLAYYELRRHARDVVPPWVMTALQKDYHNVLANNVRLYDRAQHILAAFQQASVPVLLLKGGLFAQTLYPSIGTRPMSDLDLVVHAEELEDVDAILQGLGYRPLGHGTRPRAYNLRYGGETAYRPPRSWPAVDLHWHAIFGEWVRQTTAVGDEDFWSRAESARIDGVEVRQLAPVDSLLHQVWHASVVHGFADLGLRPLVDLDRTVRTGTEWPSFVELVRRVRMVTAAHLTLDMCVRLLGTPVPPSVLDDLRPSDWRRRLLDRVLDREAIVQRRRTSARNRYLLRLLLVDRPRDVVRLSFRALFPEGEWLTARYELTSPWSRAVHRLWHPLRVLLLRGEI